MANLRYRKKSVKLFNVAYRNCFFYHQKTEKVSDIKSQIPGFQPQAKQDTPYVCNLNYLKKGGKKDNVPISLLQNTPVSIT